MSGESKQPNIHLSSLITQARLIKGFTTLKELYREKHPSVDYQSWLHAESGRRIPTPETLIEITKILDIDRQDIIIAYCRDKFTDAESQDVLESFQYKKFVNVEALIEAKDHDRSDDYVLNQEQVEAIKKDFRLRLFLTYTYDRDFKTSVKKLSRFFKISEEESRELINKLNQLGLVEVIGDEIKRVHRHTTLPKTPDLFNLRKNLLIKNLELNISEDSYISSCHVTLNDSSYKKMLSYFDFAEANLIKLDKENRSKKTPISKYQVAIVANKVRDEGGE